MKNLRNKQTIATNNQPQTQNLSDALLTKVAGGQGRSATTPSRIHSIFRCGAVAASDLAYGDCVLSSEK